MKNQENNEYAGVVYTPLKPPYDRVEQPKVESNGTLLIPVKSGYHIVQCRSIMLLEAESNYCHIHLGDGTKYLVSRTLKNIAERLRSSTFVRVHKSFLVNINFITSIRTGKPTNIFLTNGLMVTVSRAQRGNLLHQLQSGYQS